MLNVLWYFCWPGAWFTVRLPASRSLATQAAMDGATEAVSLVISLLASLCCIWG